MPGAAGSVVANFFGGLQECLCAKREEVRRHDLIVDRRLWLLREPVAHDLAQPLLAAVEIVPEKFESRRVERFQRSGTFSERRISANEGWTVREAVGGCAHNLQAQCNLLSAFALTV